MANTLKLGAFLNAANPMDFVKGYEQGETAFEQHQRQQELNRSLAADATLAETKLGEFLTDEAKAARENQRATDLAASRAGLAAQEEKTAVTTTPEGRAQMAAGFKAGLDAWSKNAQNSVARAGLDATQLKIDQQVTQRNLDNIGQQLERMDLSETEKTQRLQAAVEQEQLAAAARQAEIVMAQVKEQVPIPPGGDATVQYDKALEKITEPRLREAIRQKKAEYQSQEMVKSLLKFNADRANQFMRYIDPSVSIKMVPKPGDPSKSMVQFRVNGELRDAITIDQSTDETRQLGINALSEAAARYGGVKGAQPFRQAPIGGGRTQAPQNQGITAGMAALGAGGGAEQTPGAPAAGGGANAANAPQRSGAAAEQKTAQDPELQRLSQVRSTILDGLGALSESTRQGTEETAMPTGVAADQIMLLQRRLRELDKQYAERQKKLDLADALKSSQARTAAQEAAIAKALAESASVIQGQ